MIIKVYTGTVLSKRQIWQCSEIKIKRNRCLNRIAKERHYIHAFQFVWYISIYKLLLKFYSIMMHGNIKGNVVNLQVGFSWLVFIWIIITWLKKYSYT